MTLSKRSISKILGLIENEIDQLDVFIPRDSGELDVLMRCREDLKVEASSIDEAASESSANTMWSSSNAPHHGRDVRALSEFGCDVI